jgi:hypothetical protein
MIEWDNLYVGEKPGKGKTLFAKIAIKKDEPIIVLAGPITTIPSLFTIPIELNLFIDPVPFHTAGKYLCHDCEPSAGIKYRSVLVAYKDIAVNEEVAIDYAMIVYDYGAEMPKHNKICHCNKPECRHELGSWKHLPLSLKKEYAGYVSDYLLTI